MRSTSSLREVKRTGREKLVSHVWFTAKVFLLLMVIALPGQPHAIANEAESYDVVVYGGTSGGVAAAVQVARLGHTVVLIEPGHHLGGLTSGGLGATDSIHTELIGGISREFYQRVKQHYDDDRAWKLEKKSDFPGYQSDADAIWQFEPKVAEMVFDQMIEEAKIPVVKGERLQLDSGVGMNANRIVSIRMESGKSFQGLMFIDATYEGDLLAKAGVSYTIGREANAKYDETLNGIQKDHAIHHQFIVDVSPYVVPDDPDSGVLPGIQTDGPGKDGEGDSRIQTYNFRLCATTAKENLVAFEKPAGYDPHRYELLLRNLEAGDHRICWNPVMMPNQKTDTNNNFAVSTDNIGMNYDYPEGDYEVREQIFEEHKTYQQGLLWTLANHPRVPEEVRTEFARWGLAKDEFVDNGHWPHQMYIREARRMVSDYVMTEHDCRRERIATDSVGLGSYNMDSHNCQRYITPEGKVRNEGDIQVSPSGPYVISYRSLVPARGEAENLLVPVCISASHIAYGSIRMEPVFMKLGQSAALAAAEALKKKISVQDVNYQQLRKRLIAAGQVLDLPSR